MTYSRLHYDRGWALVGGFSRDQPVVWAGRTLDYLVESRVSHVDVTSIGDINRVYVPAIPEYTVTLQMEPDLQFAQGPTFMACLQSLAAAGFDPDLRGGKIGKGWSPRRRYQ